MNRFQVNETVRRETEYIAAVAAVLSVLMQAVFLIIGRWEYTVLLGNLFGYAAAVGNFFLMGLTVQSAVQKDPKDAANQMKISQSARMLLLMGVLALGWIIPVFSFGAVAIPLFFPRIAAALRPLLDKKMRDKGGDSR